MTKWYVVTQTRYGPNKIPRLTNTRPSDSMYAEFGTFSQAKEFAIDKAIDNMKDDRLRLRALRALKITDFPHYR